MAAPKPVSDVEAQRSRARRQSFLALGAPLFVVAILGLAAYFARLNPAQGGGGGAPYAGKTVAVTFGARLAPVGAILLRSQYQTAMKACAELQKPMSAAQRVEAEQGCLELLELYNDFAARVPAEAIASQGLPRQIPVTAVLHTAVPS